MSLAKHFLAHVENDLRELEELRAFRSQVQAEAQALGVVLRGEPEMAEGKSILVVAKEVLTRMKEVPKNVEIVGVTDEKAK